MMKLKLIVILYLFSNSAIISQSKWSIQTWVSKAGSYRGQKLGYDVDNLNNDKSLQVRALISDVKQIGGYTFNSINDTSIKKIFPGSDFLTGHLNNDKYIDIVINTVNKEGWPIAIIYWGSPFGIDTINTLVVRPDAKLDGLTAEIIGDVNNDGKEDLIITEVNWSEAFGPGRIKIFLNPITSTQPDYYIYGDSLIEGFGITPAVGDINDDGLNDLVVEGWYQYSPDRDSEFMYLNIYYAEKPNSVNTKLSQQIRSPKVAATGALAIFDVNGDKIKDVLWAVVDYPTRVHIHYGKKNRIDSIPNLKLNLENMDTPKKLYNAGDMNNDGYDDIVAGMPTHSDGLGFIAVWGGGPKIDSYFDAATGLGYISYFGSAIAPIGDVNGDNCADLLVGAWKSEWDQNYGRWFIELGNKNIKVTSIKEENILKPKNIELLQNYPNPFNPNTIISYILNKDSYVTLVVYNVLGERLKDLVTAEQTSGRHNVNFEATNYPAGIYYYRLTALGKDGKTQSETKSMSFIK